MGRMMQLKKITKHSSILDYKHKELSDAIWIDNKLKYHIRKFIEESLIEFFEDIKLTSLYHCIDSIYIGSSLATYYYTPTSDLDIKVVLDCSQLEKNPFSTVEELTEYLIEQGRNSNWLTRLLPGTYHPMDFYFYSIEEFYPISLIKYDSLYDVLLNDWLKEPEEPLTGLAPNVILDKAKEKASFFLSKITLDIARAKRDIIDFNILKDYLKSLDVDDLVLIKKEFNRILDNINDSVEQLVKDKNLVKTLRKKGFKKEELSSDLELLLGSLNYSDENLIFKILQRYGYMKILSEIEDLYEEKGVQLDTIDELEDILDGPQTQI